MNTLVDDIGSFPLPANVDRTLFNRAYELARKAIIAGRDVKKDEFLQKNFYQVVIGSLRKKCDAGLDIVNYPQHYDMSNQFLESIREATNKGTYKVEAREAIIPEISLINEEAKRLNEETGKKLLLKTCVTGPIELYLKELGTKVHEDILSMIADSVRIFAKNSILDSKYVKTVVVSIDEPSIGYQTLTTGKATDKEAIISALERAFDFNGVTKEIHLHSLLRAQDILKVKNLDVLTCEYSGSPKNIDCLSKKMLEEADKQIRVGISRTDIDSIIAELYEKGIKKPTIEQLVESEQVIKKRFVTAKQKYGNRMTYTGPDCGLGSWPSQESAQLVLKRTVEAVKSFRTT